MNKYRFDINKFKKGLQNSSVFSFLYQRLFQLKTSFIEIRTVKKLKTLENYEEDEILKMQNEKLLDILEYAYNNTEYYKNLFDDNNVDFKSPDNLKSIPLLTKEIIKNNTSDLISKEYDIKYLIKKNTGGSTGEPLEFYGDVRAGLVDYGHHSYLSSLMGYKKGDIIVACGGVHLSEELLKNDIYWKTLNKGNVFGDYIFSVLYLSNENINIYVEKLIELKPAILRGYPSFFDALATYILKNKIKLDFKIKGVILTAEMCTTNQRQNIENVFSCMVYFEYGHTEVCLYCYSKDSTYNYYSSPIYGYIELINDDGSETEVGEIGNIVVTGFINKSMPFIRYETGDLGELAYRNGGEIHFKSIYGRSQDYILSRDSEKIYLTALIFGQHFKAFANITKWQIVQNKIGEIDIYIIKDNNYVQENELEIRDKILNVIDININFKYTQNIPKTKGGKHLFLIQKLKT